MNVIHFYKVNILDLVGLVKKNIGFFYFCCGCYERSTRRRLKHQGGEYYYLAAEKYTAENGAPAPGANASGRRETQPIQIEREFIKTYFPVSNWNF
jgi:hypothetical protein